MMIKPEPSLLKMLFVSHLSALIWLSLSLIGFEVLMHWFVTESAIADSFLQFMKVAPPVFRQLIGEDGMGMSTSAGMMTLAYTHPGLHFLHFTFPCLFFNKEIAGARERGLLALNLSRPISRNSYLLNLIIVMLAGVVVLWLSITIGVKLSFLIYGVEEGFARFSYILLNMAFLTACIGSIALLISTAASSAGQSTGLMIGIPLTLYILEYVANSVKSLAFTSHLNPFHYYAPQKIIIYNHLPSANLFILSAMTLFFFIVSMILFKRKGIV